MKIISIKGLRTILACIFTLFILTACGTTGGDSTLAGTGTLATSLTDSSTEDFQGVYVTVARVEVQPGAGPWQTVATPGGTYNLLSLVNGVREELGLSPLDAGHYTQMRLILDNTPEPLATNLLGDLHPFANYFIDQNGLSQDLKVPSAYNTGIKIVQGFDISANQTTELLLDFNVMKSIVKAGNSGKYLLKPTIKMLRTIDSAVVSGLVTDGTDGIEGALVSAQRFNNDLTLDAAEHVSIERSTITAGDDLATAENETGKYRIDLPAGSYNLVAYTTGFQPSCTAVSLSVDIPTVQDFPLSAAVTGTVSGTVSISNAGVDQHATIDFRQAGHCDDPNAMISVKTVQVADTGSYTVILPVGDYQAVSSTSGATTLIKTITVTENAATSHNIAF
jgi:hypothetical protein